MKTQHYVGSSMRLGAVSALSNAVKHSRSCFVEISEPVNELSNLAGNVGLDSEDIDVIERLRETSEMSYDDIVESASQLDMLSDDAYAIKTMVLRRAAHDDEIEGALADFDKKILAQKNIIEKIYEMSRTLRANAIDCAEVLNYDAETDKAQHMARVVEEVGARSAEAIASTQFAISCFDWFEDRVMKIGFEEMEG